MGRSMSVAVSLVLLLATGAAAQSWRYTGALSEPRWDQTLTVLPQGTVLAAGGWNPSFLSVATCEIYDPLLESWRPTASMKHDRARYTATTLPDGRVVVIGGQRGNGEEGNFPAQTDLIEIFDPVTETWSDGGRLLSPRQNHRAIVLRDGTILIIAGLIGGHTVTSCEIYDPATQISRAVAPTILRRQDHNAVLLADGRVLVTGGRTGGPSSTYHNQCEIYDPLNDSWEMSSPMKDARIGGALVRFSDGGVLTAGGGNTSVRVLTGSEILDPITGRWSTVEPIKIASGGGVGILFPDDRYLLTGGIYDANWYHSTEVKTTGICQWYDRWSGRWYTAPSLNQPRARHQAVYLHQKGNGNLPNDMILIVGGHIANSTYTATCEILDVGSGAVETYMMSQENTSGVERIARSNGSLTVTCNATASPIVIYALESGSQVSLDLVGADGRLVEPLVEGHYPAGGYRLPLNTESLPEGAYFVRLRTSEGISTEKIIVVR